MRPLVPVLISFIAGLVFSERFTPSYTVLFVLIASWSAIIAVAWLGGLKFRQAAVVPGFFVLGALFILPYSNTVLPARHITNIFAAQGDEDRPFDDVFDVSGVVASWPEFDNRRTRLLVDSSGVYGDGGRQMTEGRVRVTVEGALAEPLRPGDSVRMLARLREPQNFGNPGEFDFRRRLGFRGIYATGYVKHKRFLVRTGQARPGPMDTLYRAREGVRDFIEGSGVRNAGGARRSCSAIRRASTLSYARRL